MEDARAAVVPQQPRATAKKVENEVQRRNRRVLGDIGNVNAAPVVVGVKPTVQISRPITRSFRAQLLANAQEKKEKNNVNLVLPVVDRGHAQAKNVAVVPKKAIEKPKPEAVIVISSDDEKENDRPVVHQTKPARKEVKTLTSILTARSKAMVGEVNVKPKEQIFDFDSADANNELAVVEYLDDLYKFYKLTENESRVHDYMDSQPDGNTKMRSILIDWLIDFHKKFELMPETLYLTVNIIDRYLSTKKVSRKELQLVGISSLLIAAKYEEIWAPQVDEFVCLSDYAYTGEQILLMEKAILGKLEWYLTVPTPYVFLSRYIKASLSPNDEMKNMVFFLAELGIIHYPIIILYSPSLIAAAAVYAARCTLNKMPFWTETLKHHTGFAEEQLRSCAKLMVGFHSNAAQSKLQAVYWKYSQPEHGSVARFSPAKIFQSLSSS